MLSFVKGFLAARSEDPWTDFLILFPAAGLLCLLWRGWSGAAILFGGFAGHLLVRRRMRAWPFAAPSPSLQREARGGLWWLTASPRSRRRFAAAMLLLNVALLALLIANPDAVVNRPVGLAWLLVLPFVGFSLAREAIRAHRELRQVGNG